MNFRQLLLSAIVLTLSFSVVSGQSQYDSAEDSDPAAISLLEQISAVFLDKAAHAIDYTLDIELPGTGKESQKGRLIQSGDKFVLDIGERQIVSDAQTVWLYLKEMNEVQINDADFDEEEFTLSPSDIFQLHNSKDYVFAVANHGREKGQAITQIEAKPLSDDSEYSKLRLTIADDGKKVLRLKIFSKDGSRFTMHIDKHDDTYVVDSNTFRFDASKYEGIHIEDLRF